MLAYILRRLALILPTLFGIMLINFVLVQFLSLIHISEPTRRMSSRGSPAVAVKYARQTSVATISARRDCRRILSPTSNGSSDLTSRLSNASSA